MSTPFHYHLGSVEGSSISLNAMLSLPKYVLITPVRNEAEFFESTVKSVVAQTIRPVKWVVVSDGSTDGTDDIVRKSSTDNPWIELLRMPERSERHFAGKVQAFNAGYAKLAGIQYDVVGSLDGDISFDAEYFSFLLQKLAADPRLGLVGTPFQEGENRTYDYRFVSLEHVSGACQLFRRECFEAIGGYVPVQGGGIDHIAVMTARMKGWKTRTFTEKTCIHHRNMGTAEHSILRARFRNGVKDYMLGSHPLWQIFRMFYQMSKPPVVFGAIVLTSGYFWTMIRRVPKSVAPAIVSFRRSEEMQRLKRFFLGGKTYPQPGSDNQRLSGPAQ